MTHTLHITRPVGDTPIDFTITARSADDWDITAIEIGKTCAYELFYKLDQSTINSVSAVIAEKLPELIAANHPETIP